MDLERAIYARRSVREFTARPVDEAMIRRLIDAAIQAPSAVNEQPWSFLVVVDKALLNRISTHAKAHVLKSPPKNVSSQHFQELLRDPDFDIFYGAPALIVIASATAGPWAIEDCTLAAENLMLAACGAGLGTCWIGFAQSWLGTVDGKAELDLPAEYLPVAPIIVGHPKSMIPPVPRREPEVRWIRPPV
jgi:nitroreductase